MVLDDEIRKAIKEYVVKALNEPTSPGTMLEIVPELVRLLTE